MPQTPGLLECRSAQLKTLEAETCLCEYIDTTQVLCLRCLCLGMLKGSFISPQTEVAQRQQMRSVGVARVESVQATGEEEGVFGQAVVEVVVYELSQLGIDRRGRRRHGVRVCGVVSRGQERERWG